MVFNAVTCASLDNDTSLGSFVLGGYYEDEDMELRDKWAAACLKLAEERNWEPIMFSPGQYVAGGQHGWRLFCGQANLARLRDYVYPKLTELQDTREPPELLTERT